jgi:hypothetical protein
MIPPRFLGLLLALSYLVPLPHAVASSRDDDALPSASPGRSAAPDATSILYPPTLFPDLIEEASRSDDSAPRSVDSPSTQRGHSGPAPQARSPYEPYLPQPYAAQPTPRSPYSSQPDQRPLDSSRPYSSRQDPPPAYAYRPYPDQPSASGRSPGAAPGRHGGQRLQKLQHKLGLTSDQVAMIKPIIQRAGRELKALREDPGLVREEKKYYARQIFVASFRQIRPYLTPQQLRKWRQLREERRAAAARV